MSVALCVVFFLSGAAALVFETLWFRQAGLAFGNSVWASTVVFSSFMAGLALGNGLAARLVPRIRRPLRLYAILEVVVAVSGVALVWLLPLSTTALLPVLRPFLDQPAVLNPLRFVCAFVLLTLPATAMGGTLAVLVKALSAWDDNFGRVLGRLYGWNTLGAVGGALAGETLLIERLGLRGTSLVAAALDIVAALLATTLARRAFAPQEVTGPVQAVETDRRSGARVRLLAAAFLTGATLLALEVVWFRFLFLFVFATSLAFAVMLAVVLSGIGLGGLIGAAWLRVRPEAPRYLPSLACLAGTLVVILYVTFPLPADPATTGSAPTIAGLAAALTLPICLLSGVLFTLMGAALHAGIGEAARATALLTLANTVGGMLGAALGGLILLPSVGMESAFMLLGLAYGAAAVLLGGRSTRSAAVYPMAACLVAALLLVPRGLMREHFLARAVETFVESDRAKVVAVREGVGETIQLLRADFFGQPLTHRLVTNGFSMSGTHASSQRYMKLYVYLPVAVHPAPRRALLISFGVGSTAKALTDSRALETIDIVDTSREILETSDLIYTDPARHPLQDPRVRVHLEDGRYFLQATRRRFDIITSEPPPPKLSGVTSLYSAEYFRLCHGALAEGGLVTYWLPVFSLEEGDALAIIAGFCQAFSDCSLWAGSRLSLMLVGTKNAAGPVPADVFRAQWDDPVTGPELRALGFEEPGQLGALFLADAGTLREMVRGVPPLTDDFPLRLSTRAPANAMQTFVPWTDTRRAAARFERSDLIRRLWPDELRSVTLPFFDAQRVIEDVLLGRGSRLDDLHWTLGATGLRTLVLWLVRSGAEEQRILDRATVGPAERWLADFHRGAAAMAERDYAQAALLFERSRRANPQAEQIHDWALYALLLDGKPAAARAVARELADPQPLSAARVATWTWLERTFRLKLLP